MSKLAKTFCLCLIILFGLQPAVSQQATAGAQQEKMIVRRLTLVKLPLDLSIEYNGKTLDGAWNVSRELGLRTQVFQADSAWLKNITLKLKNVSDKSITYVVVFLTFPDTAKERASSGLDLPSAQANTKGLPGLDQIFVGVDPERKFLREELRLAPGESLELRLATEYSKISQLMRLLDLPMEQVNQMEIEIHAALFSDGSMMQAGMMYKRDPVNPRRWIPVGLLPYDRNQ